MKNLSPFFSAWIALAVLCDTSMSAATIRTVRNLDDDGADSLRQRIRESGEGDEIKFEAGLSGTITLTSNPLQLGRKLTITGPGATALTINGNASRRIFEIPANVTVNISGVTISNGKNAGANGADTSGYCDPGPIHTHPTAGGPGFGGGILNDGILRLSNCVLRDNVAVGGAGGNGSEVLIFCGIIWNYFDDNGERGGDGKGGGIYNTGDLILDGCTISNNLVSGGAGGIAADISAKPNFICRYHGGPGGGGAGGAIYNTGVVTVYNSTFSQNAALGADGGRGGFYGCPFFRGGSGGHGGGSKGGAIFNDGVVFGLNCTFVGNMASGGTGGRAGYGNPNGNGGDGGDSFGGAVDTSPAACTLNSCTISGNSARRGIGGSGASGLGDCCDEPGNLGANGADGQGKGGGVHASSTASFQNTIIALNDAGSGPDFSGTASSGSGGYNLIGRTDGNSGWQSHDLTGNASPLDPLLGPLQDNGGPTFTMALLPGSAAIDHGLSDQSYTDQRGLPRAVDLPDASNASGGNAADIGAYEVQLAVQDIGLRLFDGTSKIHIACEIGTPTSPLRIRKNGITYGIFLVPLDSPHASKLHIKTSAGPKALMKLP